MPIQTPKNVDAIHDRSLRQPRAHQSGRLPSDFELENRWVHQVLVRPDRMTPGQIMWLQRKAGNQAVIRLVTSARISRQGNMNEEHVQGSPVAPTFQTLPEAAQKELIDMGLDYAYMSANPQQRMSILNIWTKMKADKLWAYVTDIHFTNEPGQLELHILDMKGFRQDLSQRSNYTNPTKKFYNIFSKVLLWDSSSKDATGQIHFKQFRGMEARSTVMAHIDAVGFLWNLKQMFRHWKHQDDWKNPYVANEALRSVPGARQSLESITGK